MQEVPELDFNLSAEQMKSNFPILRVWVPS